MSLNIDTDQRNADWVKTLAWEYPTDAELFLAMIGGPDQLEHFMTLPVSEQMPQSLAVELGVRTGKSVTLKHLPGQHDQLDHGREGPPTEGMEKLSAGIRQRYEDTLTLLSDRYPAAMNGLRGVTVRDLGKDGGLAQYLQGAHALAINSRYNTEAKLSRAVDPSYIVHGDRAAESTLVHEFGHYIDATMFGDGWGNASAIPPVSRYAARALETNPASGESSGGTKEHFAELFAAYTLGTDDPDVNAWGQALESVMAEKGGSGWKSPAKHLPGQHDQSDHGHGAGEHVTPRSEPSGFEVFTGLPPYDVPPPTTKDELAIIARLEDLGGKRVAWRGPDEDSHIIASRGQVFDGESTMMRGEPRDCHGNTSVLWADGKVDHIVTGYALSPDGVWRQHTWGLQGSGEIVETTVAREKYFGVVLTDEEAAKFAKANS